MRSRWSCSRLRRGRELRVRDGLATRNVRQGREWVVYLLAAGYICANEGGGVKPLTGDDRWPRGGEYPRILGFGDNWLKFQGVVQDLEFRLLRFRQQRDIPVLNCNTFVTYVAADCLNFGVTNPQCGRVQGALCRFVANFRLNLINPLLPLRNQVTVVFQVKQDLILLDIGQG